MFVTALTLALATSPAHALTPPAGWTATGPHRAVRDINNPALGELREFNITGGTGASIELEMMLRAAGAEAQSLNPNGSGAVGLLLQDQRLGRARFKAGTDGGTWMVVMAGAAAAGAMDPDAVITAAFTPKPAAAAAWGGQAAAPAPAAPAATPWGASAAPAAAAPAPAAAAPAWVQPSTAADTGWVASPELVGRWAGTAFIKFAPTKLVFDFKADGTVTVERSANGRSQTLKGTWGTNGGRMRLQVPGGGESVPFTVSGTSAGFPFEDAKVSLQKQ